MKTILMQKKDSKSVAWSKAAQRQNLGKILPVEGSPMYLPIVFCTRILSGKRPDALCFRYLNDYPGILRTLARFATDICAITLARISNVPLLWVCHNVEKESSENYPLLSRIRRAAVARSAKMIFVTDPLLLSHATHILNVPESKVKSICLGPALESAQTEHAENDELKVILDWVSAKRKAMPDILIGLWIGTFAEKTKAGLQHIFHFTEKANRGGYPFGMVVIGPIAEALARADPELWKRLIDSDNILVVGRQFAIPPTVWNRISDFVWKPLNDLSVALTMYHAAEAQLPIICESDTFFSELVEHHTLGFGVDFKEVDWRHLKERIQSWEVRGSTEFLKNHNWDIGARALFESIA